jgi:hypothetical protein
LHVLLLPPPPLLLLLLLLLLLQKLVVNDARAQGVLLPSLGYASQLPPIRPSFNKRW